MCLFRDDPDQDELLIQDHLMSSKAQESFRSYSSRSLFFLCVTSVFCSFPLSYLLTFFLAHCIYLLNADLFLLRFCNVLLVKILRFCAI